MKGFPTSQKRSGTFLNQGLFSKKHLMASAKASLLILTLQLALVGNVSGGDVLIWPTEASHWLNIKIILQEMMERGHNVSILVSTAALFIQPGDLPAASFELYPVPFGKDDLESLIKDIIMLWLHNRPTTLTFYHFYKELGNLMKKANMLNKQMCDGVLANPEFLARLQKRHFDVLLSDPVTICGDLVALKLGIPFVYTLRFTPASTVERYCGMLPAPPSYVPAALSELTDRMSFGERIKNILSYHVQDYVFRRYWGEWDSYYSQILDNSHWINLKVILQELTARGHHITVLLPSFFQVGDFSPFSTFHLEEVTVPFPKAEMNTLIREIFHLKMYEQPKMSSWEFFSKFCRLVVELFSKNKIVCDMVVSNEELMKKLQLADFDALVADPLMPCGELVAEKLRIPFVYSFRFSVGNTLERLCGALPAPPSYVPASVSGLTDRMSFAERMKNLLFYSLQDIIFHQVLFRDWDQYYSEILGRPTTLCETIGKAELWLIRTYWDFEFPRPFLPNFEFVGGLHCLPAKPLPEEMEEFVQSSGEHGLVVFSLGSMVQNLTDEKSTEIALALSRIPQRVIWRYKGKRPSTLGANTRLYDWIPQNDLLGHPKTKAFITHGGTNGIYEAIYHGIPMVGIPLFADQPDNIAHMRAKGMAVELNFHTMTAQDLVEAVNTVIHNATYKDNAVRLSRIHHDQPIKPLARAVFWIEFVMRHKSAKHLRPAAHHLNWYQYHCLDILAFLAVCAAVFLFSTVKCCMFCCWKCGRRVQKRKTE
ncbi:LOW QUALITY PROTEIN: UDP-glucuronosyltransferase 2A2-like [Paroedura picta]|uniref:LOW QUALITY PROTEIN: UDP-glucuronosyltransferase 2A2-like n=1 Tax=Paroedura picta TaxID=143630 RepID=UPI004056346D